MTDTVLIKAHNKGYTRKDGVHVSPFNDSRPGAKPTQKKSPAKAILDMFGHPHEDYPSMTPSWFPGAKAPQKHYPNAKAHPSKKDDGSVVKINEPEKSTNADAWVDPDVTAIFAVGDRHNFLPDDLYGVELTPWIDHPEGDDWDFVEGQMDELNEPHMHLPQGKQPASGVIVEEPDGRIWVVSPTNGFGGYKNVFPKGKAEEELSLQANAIKECFEESGLKVEITGLLGDFERLTSVTRYYMARRVGGTPADVGWETQAVKLAPKSALSGLLNSGYDNQIINEINPKTTI